MNEISIFGKGIYRLKQQIIGREINGMVRVEDVWEKVD